MDAGRSGLVVLGMHRSGTSAIAGVLRLCGAWVGEDAALTAANIENPKGFWERRDVRKVCDALLHSAGADWWKVAGLNLEAIPHAILSEQRRRFAEVVSELREHDPWVVKEPRLCLLLPLLRDYLDGAVCVHVFRNPLEVARSLQRRNGFSIAAGMALWETYNRHALKASWPMPRVMVGYGALMRDPEEAIDRLVARLAELGVMRLAVPDESTFRQFIQPVYHRHRVTVQETDRYLTPDQKSLWKQIRSEDVLAQEPADTISAAATQHLYDLESSQQSVRHHEDRIKALNAKLVEYREQLTIRETELVSRGRELAARNEELAARNEELAARDEELAARDEELAARNEELAARDEELAARNEELAARDEELDRRAQEVAARDERIRDLLDSTSWRMTAPLRALSVACRKGPGAVLRSLRRVRRATTRHLASAKRSSNRIGTSPSGASSSAAGMKYADTDSLRKLVRRHRELNDHRVEEMSPGILPENERRTRISVIAWNMGHNALGRAYLLADLLRSEYDVEIIGAIFPQFGTELWGPLRDCSRVTMKFFPGSDFPEHFTRMEDVAEQIDGDIIYVSKPRLPAVELALLAKQHRNRPIILDVDDYELGWFRKEGSLTLEEVARSEQNRDFARPQAATWTRYCESLVPLFDHITVSNEELQKKFGGVILPHVRSEHDFEPGAYPRDEIRAELGFGTDDKVVLFAGTLRMHKGVAQIVQAVKKLRHLNCKLMIVGAPPDDETWHSLRSVDATYVRIIPDVPFLDLPGYLCAGDLVCLLQDPNDVNSQFQMPAKFTDALAMGIPVLASNAPPLMNLARDGLVELLGTMPLEKKIEEMLVNHHIYRAKAQENRGRFLSQYSYGACRPWMKSMIDRLLEIPSPTPAEFHDLIDYHRAFFSGSRASSTTLKDRFTVQLPGCTSSDSDGMTAPPIASRARNIRTFVDDKIDIVFFWKQNDTGIYGRRQDMLVKYLAMESRIQRIFHFDAPINLLRSGGVTARTGGLGGHSHARLVLFNTLRRRFFRGRWTKVRPDTFTFLVTGRASRMMKWLLPCEDDYLDYLERVFKRYGVGERRVIFWVCPNNFRFPSIERRFQPDLIVADVIDDQRKWDTTLEHEERLTRNYREILGRSDLVFVNCDNVLRSMREFADNIYLLPNAAEILEPEACSWNKPLELARMRGPVIGYVGNLDAVRINLELLEAVAADRPDWNLVFIGSMHRGGQILRLSKFKNVHFLGVRIHDDAVRYIRHFDVAIIPHHDNALTRNMNPLKLYVYFSLHVPVVTTPIANTEDFQDFVRIGRTPADFIGQIEDCLEENPVSVNREYLRVTVERNSWPERVKRILELIDKEFGKGARTETSLGDRTSSVGRETRIGQTDGCVGRCALCGHTGNFLREESVSIRENYRCEACKASLRYREQARLIVKHFAREGSDNVGDLVKEKEFRSLKIYEPGIIGPFRRYLRTLPQYRTSFLWMDVPRGEYRRGVQCQDLTNLTYDDDCFDLVISSDIFEHVRKPFEGFREVNRVLKPGGFHIFSIPVACPMASRTVFRVDTSGHEDILVLPAHYHGAPMGGKSLVYTDFGADMTEMMERDGIELEMEDMAAEHRAAGESSRVVTFYWRKRI